MTNYDVIQEENRVEVVLSGDITLDHSFEFKDEIKKKILEMDVFQVMVNLEAVDFVDSSGLGLLISLFKEVNEKQGKIVFFGVQSYLQKLLSLVKLDQVFVLAADRSEALDYLAH